MTITTTTLKNRITKNEKAMAKADVHLKDFSLAFESSDVNKTSDMHFTFKHFDLFCVYIFLAVGVSVFSVVVFHSTPIFLLGCSYCVRVRKRELHTN